MRGRAASDQHLAERGEFQDFGLGEARHGQTLRARSWTRGLRAHRRGSFASSKTCSGCCRVKTTLSLSERTYRCDGLDGWGLVLDRDVNAAVNLARWPGNCFTAAAAAAEPPPVSEAV